MNKPSVPIIANASLDRDRAQRLRDYLIAIDAAAEAIESALDLLVTTGHGLRFIMTESSRLGVTQPSYQQLDRSLRSVLRRRHFERKTLNKLAQPIERRIAELEQEAA
jgi:hypothetical protein